MFADYAQYIAQVANVQLGEGLSNGTTVTFIDPSVLEAAHVLDPTTMEIQGSIQIPASVNIEHVILEQPMISQLEGLSTVTAASNPIVEPPDIKPPLGKVCCLLLYCMFCEAELSKCFQHNISHLHMIY